MKLVILLGTLCICLVEGGILAPALLPRANFAYNIVGSPVFPALAPLSQFPVGYAQYTYPSQLTVPPYFAIPPYPAVVSAPGVILADGLQIGGGSFQSENGSGQEESASSTTAAAEAEAITTSTTPEPHPSETAAATGGDEDTVAVEAA